MIAKPTDVFSKDYDDLFKIYSAQQAAPISNNQARATFQQLSADWVADYKAKGVAPGPPPALPSMTVVADDGTVTHPPFPDLALAVAPTFGGPSAGIASTTVAPPMDRTDKMILMLGVLNGKLDALLAKVPV